MKASEKNITELKAGEIFVFGSNESGWHGGGAAKFAKDKFGAVLGVGFGCQGQSFAIPTKDWHIITLALPVIEHYVHRFLEYGGIQSKNVFLVTEIGCGLAGLTPQQIAPMFKDAPENVHLPKSFIDIIQSL